MIDSYTPPFTMTDEITNLVIEIAELAGEMGSESNENKVIDAIREDGNITAAGIAQKLGLSQRQVQRILKNLKEKGAIERAGSNRNGQYIAR